MIEPVSEKPASQNSGAGIFIGCMAALYICVCLLFGIYAYIFLQQIPAFHKYFPTAIPTPTATPIAHQPGKGDTVFKDDFSDNKNDWYVDTSPPAHLEVRNGKLYINSEDSVAFVYCRQCPTLTSPYYLQADFSTDRPTKEMYGIGFSSEKFHSFFYMFEITTDPAQYIFYKFKNRNWTERIWRKSNLIKPYPNVNTLGVSLDHDLITLYINGQIVDTYEDTGNVMSSGTFWPYIESTGFTLVLDNIYSYGK